MLIRDARMYADTGQMQRDIVKARRNPMGLKQSSDRGRNEVKRVDIRRMNPDHKVLYYTVLYCMYYSCSCCMRWNKKRRGKERKGKEKGNGKEMSPWIE
jgi:hypothetical protein